MLVDGYFVSLKRWYIIDTIPLSSINKSLLFASNCSFAIRLIKMKTLIIDAALEKIFFKIIDNSKLYTTEHLNCRENFDNFVDLLFKFFEQSNVNIKEIDNIFINQGPGKFSGIRTSISVAKSLSLSGNINLYGFNSDQYLDKNHKSLIKLAKEGVLKKNLIKPNYSS